MGLADKNAEVAGHPIDAEAFGKAMPSNELARIAVAVSGGADSMALVLLADQWARARSCQLTALTVDHHLRPESASEAKSVAQWLSARGIAHEILIWDEGEKLRHLTRSAQDAARVARLDLLTAWCRTNGYEHILLAHHADDQVETFFMRLARGSGLQGLGGMDAITRYRGVTLLRPLLSFAKSDLIATCQAFGQSWIDDPSNQNSKYTRTRFRKSRALLESEGLTRERILSTMAHLQRARVALNSHVRALHNDACVWSDFGAATLSARRFLAAPEDVSLRLLSDVLRSAGGQTYGPRFDSLQRLHAKLRNGQVNTVTLHGCCIARSGDAVTVCREPSAIGEAVTLKAGLSVLWDGRFEITYSGAQLTSLRVRPYRPEDKRAWLAAGEAVALSEIPSRIRRSLPVIEDDDGLVAMPHADLWRSDSGQLAVALTIRFVGLLQSEFTEL
ncbi:MAG: tRNA lysidine(34) synthetase TilS [Rhodospirillaceae bacterium]|nr:tRNA lysidine(34) synthetase TilS [Rhodospirillaceae bacterium]